MTGGDHFQPKKPEEPTVEQLQWELKVANTRLEKQAAYAVDNMALAEQIARLDGEKAATEKEVVRLRGLVDAQQKTVDQVGSENLELEKRVAELEGAGYEIILNPNCETDRAWASQLQITLSDEPQQRFRIYAEALARRDGDCDV